jgi:hypothetical protein
VIDPSGRGVLVIFFDAAELAEAPRQVPPHVLWRVLSGLCQLIPDSPGVERRAPERMADLVPDEPPAEPQPPHRRPINYLEPRSS